MKSNTLGTLTIGRHDFHYGKSTQEQVDMGGALQSSLVSLIDYGSATGKTTTAMYNATRYQNSMKYTSPSLNGLNAVIGYTTAGGGTFEAGDMVCAGGAAVPAAAGVTTALPPSSCTTAVASGSNNRKGSGWFINPEYRNGPLFLGYSYLNVKPDLVASKSDPALGTLVLNAGVPGTYANTGVADQKSNQVYGQYMFGNFHIGFNYNQSEQKNSNTGAQILKRTAWAIPASYSWGPHHVAGGYAKAGNNTGPAGEEASTGAKMMSIAYIYDFSKRTKVGLTYSQIKNDANAAYNFYTNTSFSSTDVGTLTGEKPSFWALTFNHYF